MANRAGTSQAALSAYEGGAKEPTLGTLSRLLAAAGERLVVARGAPAVREPSRRALDHAGRGLAEVMVLAEALPVRHEARLHFPRLKAR